MPKHVKIDRNFIREKIEDNIIQMHHIPSQHRIADLFTKPVSNNVFLTLVVKLGCINLYIKLEEECRKTIA